MVGVICILLSVLFHIFMAGPATFNPADHWKTANEGKGGGVLGGMLGHLMMCAFDKAGSLVLIFSVMFILVLYVFGITPRGLWIYVRYKAKIARERKEERDAKLIEERLRVDEERERYLREREAERERRRAKTEEDVEYSEPRRYRIKRKRPFTPDIPIDGEDEVTEADAVSPEAVSPEEIDERIFDEAMRRTKARRAAEEKACAEDSAEGAADTESSDQLPLVEIHGGDAGVTETVAPVDTAEPGDAASPKNEKVDLKKI